MVQKMQTIFYIMNAFFFSLRITHFKNLVQKKEKKKKIDLKTKE